MNASIPLLWRCLHFHACFPFPRETDRLDYSAFQRVIGLLAAEGTLCLGDNNGVSIWIAIGILMPTLVLQNAFGFCSRACQLETLFRIIVDQQSPACWTCRRRKMILWMSWLLLSQTIPALFSHRLKSCDLTQRESLAPRNAIPTLQFHKENFWDY